MTLFSTLPTLLVRTMCCLMIAQPAWAEPAPLRSDANTSAKRFYPISDNYRAGGTGTPTKELRSDRDAMNSGFMRIDRKPAPTPPQVVTLTPEPSAPVAPEAKAPITPPQGSRESEEIEGLNEAYDPVLSLFDYESTTPLKSFKDAMEGAKAPSVPLSALTRHPVWPIPLRYKQYISSGYGMRQDPFTHEQAFHGGIDIVAETGTTVVASADGVVVDVGKDRNYGNYIAIQHADGTRSRYGHLSAQQVVQGQSVHAGQAIGAVGSTGRSTGPHLDYRVSKNNTKYDPLSVLTIPHEVAFNNDNKVPVASPFRRGTGKVASNALPKQPMVIEVR